MAEPARYPGIPLWVKVGGIIVIVVVVIVVGLLVSGAGGDHGPGRHSGTSGNPPLTDVPAGLTPTAGRHG